MFREFFGILKRFRQIIDSQANLTQIEKGSVLSVAALIGIESAFAENFIIQKILASTIVSPLSRSLLNKVASGKITYYQMFQRDLNLLLTSKKIKDFNIVKHAGDIHPNKVNLLLSIEGAHSLQGLPDSSSEKEKANSILSNFNTIKQNQDYRFHHLTLTHLTRQSACVHCFGVKMEMLGADLMPDIRFQPDPLKKGISALGMELIALSYDDIQSKRILIDIKHMSFFSRMQFYKMREQNGWNKIPIVVSHAGVTGTSFKKAKVEKIIKASDGLSCDQVFWNKAEGLCNTSFNPWTINLFREDILEVLQSNGLIGISLDQRIVGYGEIFGEYISPQEIEDLNLYSRLELVKPESLDNMSAEESIKPVFEEFLMDLEVLEILHYETKVDESAKTHIEDKAWLGGETLFDLDISSNLILGGKASHIDYLANNIIYILKTGFENKFDGEDGRPDVLDCVCIGSDLDGLIDAMNFPGSSNDISTNENNWITIDEYASLQAQLVLSITKCIDADEFMLSRNMDVDKVVYKIMVENGRRFLEKNFV